MRTALITGDLGFVGRHVARRLRSDGWAVHGLDVARSPDEDVRYWFEVNDGDYDLVIHCAARVGGRATIDSQPLWLAGSDFAIDGALWLWALRNRPGRIVYFSSSAAYPVALQGPGSTRRLAEHHLDFDCVVLAPDQTYGWVKLTGEVCARAARHAGLLTTVLRPFSGYGADQSLDYPFPSFIERARARQDPFDIWGSGHQVRDWVHIDDIVETVMRCVEYDEEGPLNICTGRPTSFLELAELVCKAAGYQPEFRCHPDKPAGVDYRVGDPTRLRPVYEPQISLEQGIEMALLDSESAPARLTEVTR